MKDVPNSQGERERHAAMVAEWEAELDSVEYLLSRGLWSNEQERMALRQRQTDLMDKIAEAS